MSTIEFSVAFNKNYAEYALSTVYALWKHNRHDYDKVCILIFASKDAEGYDEVFDKLQQSLEKLEVRFIVVPSHFDEAVSNAMRSKHEGYYSTASFYRLLIPRYSREPRTIYVDVDTLALGPAKKFYEADMEGSVIAASLDGCFLDPPADVPWSPDNVTFGRIAKEKLFSTGIILFDNRRLSGVDVEALINYEQAVYEKFNHADTSFVNDMFYNRILEFPREFNEMSFDYGYGKRKLPEETVFFSYCLSLKPWSRINEEEREKYANFDLKKAFFDDYNEANRLMGRSNRLFVEDFL